MANTQRAIVRAEPALIREAAERAGFTSSTPVSTVIRYALAVVAGKPDPHSVAVARPGPKPKPGGTADTIRALRERVAELERQTA